MFLNKAKSQRGPDLAVYAKDEEAFLTKEQTGLAAYGLI